MVKLDNRSLHQKVREMIYDLVDEKFNAMEKIPSEQKLSEILGVSRNTVREAVKSLEQEGILFSRHGVGTFLFGTNKGLRTMITTLESSTNIILSHGYVPGTKNVSSDVRQAAKEVNNKLTLNDDEKVFYIERVRTADDESVVYIEDYIPYKPNMENEYKENHYESLLHFLGKYNMNVAFSNCSLKAVISDEKTERKLGLKNKCALLLLKQVHYSSSGIPVLYSDSYYISDKFEFNVIRKRVLS